MKITKTREGNAYLHVWREGEEYFRQKGKVLIEEWTNVMFSVLAQPDVDNMYYVDISAKSLHFPNSSFDAVNAYHVFEHLTPREGEHFALEILRVLKPGGIFRISVPDLEQSCRKYLHHLAKAVQEPTDQNLRQYKWSVMEIFEQMVRDKSGGLMLEAIRSGEYDEEYLNEYYSDVFRPFYQKGGTDNRNAVLGDIKKTVLQQLMRVMPKRLYLGLARRIKKVLIKRLVPEETILATNHPLVRKEAVRWMYDRLSLQLLAEKVGFVEFKQMTFKDSDIPHWDQYDLDRSNHGDRPIDPSVYVECRRPGIAT